MSEGKPLTAGPEKPPEHWTTLIEAAWRDAAASCSDTTPFAAWGVRQLFAQLDAARSRLAAIERERDADTGHIAGLVRKLVKLERELTAARADLEGARRRGWDEALLAFEEKTEALRASWRRQCRYDERADDKYLAATTMLAAIRSLAPTAPGGGEAVDWKAARDECERQFQAKVAELGTEVALRLAAEADAARLRSEAVGLALVLLFPDEPADSRAVSDEFVALSAINCGVDDDKCWAVIKAALDRYSSALSPEAKTTEGE